MLDAREALLRDLDAFRRDAGADFAAALRDEMQDFVAAYRERKQRAGKLDFVDLLLLVRDLVRDNREVRHYLQNRFARIFVDEFQDTDPLQAEILILLSADDPAESDWRKVTPSPGKLFVVGDPKQSIYKFRRADVVLYDERLRGAGHARRGAHAPDQELPRRAADPATGERGLRPGDDRRSPWRPGALCAARRAHPRQRRSSRPSWCCRRLSRTARMRISKDSINACLPEAIAAYIDWLRNESGWKVRDPRDDARVPLRAKHICVLFRR